MKILKMILLLVSLSLSAMGACDTSTAITREVLMEKIGNGEDVTQVNTCAITDMSHLFWSLSWPVEYGGFTQDISGWDTSNVTNMSHMFENVWNFNQDISGWDTSNVRDMSFMFSASESFNQDISNWDFSKVTTMSKMFHAAALSIENYDALLNGLQSQTLQSGVEFDILTKYSDAGVVARQKLIDDYNWTINDGGKLDSSLNSCNLSTALTGDVLANFLNRYAVNMIHADTCAVRDMPMFLDIKTTSGQLGSNTLPKNLGGGIPSAYWNTENVIDMSNIFVNTSYFADDLSTWDTSKVRDMSGMFANTRKVNPNISEWNTSSVTNMSDMFYESEFSGDLSKWDTSNVSNMNSMFFNASFNNGSISNWDTSSVTNMSYMFASSSFNQDISKWDFSKVTNMKDMFSSSRFSTENYDAFLNGLAGQNLQSGVRLDVSAHYSDAGAVARQKLIDVFGWIINDGTKISSPTVQNKVYLNGNSSSSISQWSIFGGRDSNEKNITILNDETLNSKVVVLSGIPTSQSKGYSLGGNKIPDAWKNPNTDMLWKMKYTENFVIYIGIETTTGYKYLKYTSADTDGGLSSNGNYIHHGLGRATKDGTWKTIERDLQADLELYDLGNKILFVNEFRVLGSGVFDDITLSRNTSL